MSQTCSFLSHNHAMQTKMWCLGQTGVDLSGEAAEGSWPPGGHEVPQLIEGSETCQPEVDSMKIYGGAFANKNKMCGRSSRKK